MAIRSKSKRKKGPQQPQKYPIPVGSNYLYWGEQPGYIYDPWKDQYLPDPRLSKEYAEKQGLIEKQKKPPGMWEQTAAAVLPQLVTQAGLLGIKSWLDTPGTKPLSAMIGPGQGALSNAGYEQLANMFQNYIPTTTPAGGLVGIGDSSDLSPAQDLYDIGLGSDGPDTFAFNMNSQPDFTNPVNNNSWLDDLYENSWLQNLYQNSWLQSGISGLGGLLGLV